MSVWVLAGSAAVAGPPVAVTDADYGPVDMAQVRLGQMLFYDPLLSGNRNISCATCHHPKFGTADGVALSLGEGGIGLGPERRPDPDNMPEQRIPRNAPALFNLGAREFTVLFHDGRIEADAGKPGGIRTPMGAEMNSGFASLLSAQTMFPVLSADEMAGHYSENEISKAVRQGRITGSGGAWDLLSTRVQETPGYAPLVTAAFPDEEDFGFTHISDAIAAFMAFEWRSDTSPFDAHLRGEQALQGTAAAGMDLFYGSAGCADCHSGPFLTDHSFHAMGVPQFGPGKAARFEQHVRDTGRMRVTGRVEDAYAFRTPSLRNVAATGPYGHTGSHADLRGFLAYHADPATAFDGYDPATVRLPDLPGVSDWRHIDDPAAQASLKASVTAPARPLSDTDLDRLIAFLGSLTDETAIQGRLGIPDAVPSGLPIDR
ncbi:cytochrome c peroxidase [uncultured Roseobacter sp.]|uniref:cytochrome-c peroxidase n=1 Tax=uncultured Roseobacter sp. TaxID=114847 RepID=UPI0026231EE1|nr:cytochrome c peroxidase [uncultured Roseobacter sp.]